MDPIEAFQFEAKQWLQDAAAALGYDGDLPGLEDPPSPEMGDAGMPCFPLAKALRKAPVAIASELAGALDAPQGGWIRDVQAVGPYVNFFLDKNRLAKQVLDDPAGSLKSPVRPGLVLIEHTSANPNGPLHVGRARNPILGDTLVRLHRAAGYDTRAHYYMDNLGRQVALLAWGKNNLDAADLPPVADGREGKPDHDLVRYYQAANEKRESDSAVAAQVAALVADLEACNPEALALVRPVYEACFTGMQQSLSRLGVAFDQVDDESDHVEDGTVARVIEGLQASPRHGVTADGAHYLDLSAELKGNKSTNFHFTRRDGTSVYATRDIAYHQWKSDFVGEGGHLIDVLGEDHRLQSLQVGIALDELGARRPRVVFYAFVGLPDGKMSTRANRVVFLDDLLDEAVQRARDEVGARRGDDLPDAVRDAIAEAVGIAAIRFNIAKVQPEKPIQFRWEEALSFDGDSAPYLMYAHARAASLLRNAEAAGLDASGTASLTDAELAKLGEPEYDLLALVARFSREAKEACDEAAPHRFCSYALELASSFTSYYRDRPVLACDDVAAQRVRLATVQAAKAALGAAHEALGLPCLDEM